MEKDTVVYRVGTVAPLSQESLDSRRSGEKLRSLLTEKGPSSFASVVDSKVSGLGDSEQLSSSFSILLFLYSFWSELLGSGYWIVDRVQLSFTESTKGWISFFELAEDEKVPGFLVLRVRERYEVSERNGERE